MADSHSYFDWQVSTLMLAYDVLEPIARDDEAKLAERQQACEHEVHALAMSVIPRDYRENPGRDFPPEVVMLLTRATLKRAAQIVALL